MRESAYRVTSSRCGSTFAAALFAAFACATWSRADAAPREVPILFNDHTVHAKPSIIERDRVLAALIENGRIYVPLRAMFEQMGATVSASADGKTVNATKSGASVSVTLGKHEVIVDGESRALDVPPMLYHHIMLVPVRVLSEALGAYVQWLPDRRLVVVRYLPPPAAAPVVPPPAAPVIPPPVPTPMPAATPAQRSYRGFIAAAIAAPHTYNEYSAGQYCPESYWLSAAYALENSPFAAKVDFRQDVYVTSDNLVDGIGNHYTHFATIDGGTAFAPVFKAKQSNLDVRLEYRIAAPRVYVGLSYLEIANNYGYPHLSGIGAGIEKLPDLRSGLRFFGSAFYYPTASGNYTVGDPSSSNFGKAYRQQYQIVKYDLGLALVAAHLPVYAYGGYGGDRYIAKQSAPIAQTHDGPYLGLGVKL